MIRLTARRVLAIAACGVLALAILGCNRQPAAPTDQAPQAEAPATGSDAGSQTREDADPKLAEALAALTPEDRAAAEKQKICPVSGQPLGSMGTPVKVTVSGRDVFICCPGCEDSLKKDPETYLAKLPQ